MKKPIAQLFIGAMGFLLFTACHKTPPPPLASPPVPVVESGLPEPPHTDPLSQGMWRLYHIQYDQARKAFAQYSEAHPREPAGYFYQTATDWWQLAQNFEIRQPEVIRRFEYDSEQTIRVAETLEKSKKADDRARALLYEGGAWGLRGRFEVTQRHWLDAYRAGKRGRGCLKKALDLDPQLDDAYLGLGIYDYYADTLRGVQAVLSALLMHGDRKRGIEEIERAKNNGKHARVEAMLFLIDIYASWEKQPGKAVALARELYRDYPQSPAMHLAVISTLAAAAKWESMSEESAAFLDACRKGTPFYGPAQLPAALYYTGLGALHLEHPDLCIERMNDVLKMKDIPSESRWMTFAYLRRGQAYDIQGKRAQALADYKRVLARPDVWDSYKEASSCVKTPWTPQTDVTSTKEDMSK